MTYRKELADVTAAFSRSLPEWRGTWKRWICRFRGHQWNRTHLQVRRHLVTNTVCERCKASQGGIVSMLHFSPNDAISAS